MVAIKVWRLVCFVAGLVGWLAVELTEMLGEVLVATGDIVLTVIETVFGRDGEFLPGIRTPLGFRSYFLRPREAGEYRRVRWTAVWRWNRQEMVFHRRYALWQELRACDPAWVERIEELCDRLADEAVAANGKAELQVPPPYVRGGERLKAAKAVAATAAAAAADDEAVG